ncbi:unnamed protein product, partial [Penicillium palitans]
IYTIAPRPSPFRVSPFADNLNISSPPPSVTPKKRLLGRLLGPSSEPLSILSSDNGDTSGNGSSIGTTGPIRPGSTPIAGTVPNPILPADSIAVIFISTPPLPIPPALSPTGPPFTPPTGPIDNPGLAIYN